MQDEDENILIDEMDELTEVEIGKRIKKTLKENWDYYHTPKIQEKHKGGLDIVNAVDYQTWEKEAIEELVAVASDSNTFWDSMERLFKKSRYG